MVRNGLLNRISLAIVTILAVATITTTLMAYLAWAVDAYGLIHYFFPRPFRKEFVLVRLFTMSVFCPVLSMLASGAHLATCRKSQSKFSDWPAYCLVTSLFLCLLNATVLPAVIAS